MIEFSWGGYKEGDLRFVTHRYRAGGPWITRRVVHDLDGRYGVSFRTGKGWRFFGLVCLENQRVENEPDVTTTSVGAA